MVAKRLPQDSIVKDSVVYSKVIVANEEKLGNKFEPPTVEEVEKYCKERNNKINAAYFVNYYASRGWTVGKSPMVSWKSAMVAWERNSTKYDTSDENKFCSINLEDFLENK